VRNKHKKLPAENIAGSKNRSLFFVIVLIIKLSASAVNAPVNFYYLALTANWLD
jgi:hypothetical protein